ncbi:MAG: hypothetical protein JWO19_743 [Bryobacterales bacterium]|jgi:hypothetical protein|nr:hypothetical protein [Bryobacterales bacterium]
MDPDVRSSVAGVCPRCGMKLAANLPEATEYHMDLSTSPRTLQPGQPAQLTFAIHDPWKGRPVTNFQVVHEKLFHMFVISQDLEFFIHNHPVFQPDGSFRYDDLTLPKAGMYRVLGDFYPDGATPQLIAKTIIVPGTPPAAVHLSRDYSAKDASNMQVDFRTDPPQVIAGLKTQLHFTIKPGDGLEKYLGAWGHMLAASEDLIDLIHTHPFIADGGPNIQFNLTFPRPGNYRVWVQFQRSGVVNTAHFDIPVQELQ